MAVGEGRTAEAPPRGKRPRNRRALILTAAADLFARHGYPQVGMSDLAEAVAVQPSALYRHFSGKQELLLETVRAAIEPGVEILARAVPGELDRLLGELAAGALDHRHLGVLWQRESRHLPAAQRAELRDRMRAAMRALRTMLQSQRGELDAAQAELLAWCAFAVLISVSYQRADLPRARYEQLLADMLRAVFAAPVHALDTRVRPRSLPGLGLRSRREVLLATATRLFAEHGYANVGIEDIATAAGLAGPSVYNHFSGKADLLATALHRGDEALRMDMIRALGAAHDSCDALRRTLDAYIALALDRSDLVEVLIAEVAHLPEPVRLHIQQTQRDIINEWVLLLCDAHPALDPATARVRVQAALTVVNDVACTPHLRSAGTTAETLQGIGAALLRLPAQPTSGDTP